jgi:hypothetical protein
MNTIQKVSFGLIAFVSSLSIATLADAGTGIGGKPNSGGYSQYRAYSYEPAPLVLKAGDMAVVTKAKAELKIGDRVLTTVPQGTKFTIVQTWGTWIGANVEQNGQKFSGWIANTDVASNPAPTVSTGR